MLYLNAAGTVFVFEYSLTQSAPGDDPPSLGPRRMSPDECG